MMRSTTLSPVANDRSACVRTLVSTQEPPTKPTIEPSASMTARSPGFALVGRSALTTVARTKGGRGATVLT